MATKEPKFASSDPSVNWLSHVLTENVGWVEWVPKTPEELEAYKKTLPSDMRAKAYPLKVVRHPIPEGTEIILKDSKDYVVAVNSQDVRDMLVGLAQRYEHYMKSYWRVLADSGNPWKPASEWPDQRHSACRKRTVIVDSGILHYLGGLHLGYHDYDTDTWYLHAKGKAIPHKVEYWRHIPNGPCEAPEYETVKAEVEQLRLDMEREPHNMAHAAYMLLRGLLRNDWKITDEVKHAAEDLRQSMNERSPGTFSDEPIIKG